MKFIALISAFAAAVGSIAKAQEALPHFEQSLGDALQTAETQSGTLKSAQATEDAATFQARSAKSFLLPNLSIQGNYFYQTNVPTLSLGPFGEQNFGTHNNYSAGPVLSYTLFDGGKDHKNYEGANLQAQARGESKKAERAQLELLTRQAYFRVQYALRELDLTLDSLKLSLAQSRDISLRFRAGAASQLDEAQAKRDVLSYRLRFRQAQTELAADFRSLLALEGDRRDFDSSRIVPIGMKPLEGVERPTLELELEPLQKSVETLSRLDLSFSAEMHPEAKSFESQAQAAHRLAESETSGLYPKITLQARTMYEYPNVVLPENTWQSSFGASISFPLFEGDASRSRSNQHLSEAISNESLREQKLTDLTRDQAQARDAVSSLKAQKMINDDNVVEAQVVQRLTYESYKGGKSRYLDVQDANLKLLQAQVLAAQIDSEILNQLASLAYLSVK